MKIINIFIVVGLFIIFFTEALGFSIGFTNRPLYQFDKQIEYILKPNQQLTRFGNEYIVNSYSMRAKEFPDDFYNTSKYRIMVYGDSIVNGGTRLDQAKIATELLQAKLNNHDNNIYVGNVSAGSWGPENILAYVEKNGVFQADAAIVVLSSHDALDVPTFTELGKQSHPVKHHKSTLFELYLKYIKTDSQPSIILGVQDKIKKIINNHENKQLTALLRLLKKQVAKVVVIQHYSLDELSQLHRPKGHSIIYNSCMLAQVNCIDTKFYYLQNKELTTLYLDNLHLSVKGQLVLSSIFNKTLHL